MRDEVISERSERGTKYDIVTRAIKLILRVSNVITYLSHTCAFIWVKYILVPLSGLY